MHTNTVLGSVEHRGGGDRLVRLCPMKGCRRLGGTLVRKEVTNGKTKKVYHYWYFEHHISRGKTVSHYLGPKKPRIKKAVVKLVPI